MKVIHKQALYICTIMLLLAGCKLDKPVFPLRTSPGVASSATYQPVTAGSYWKYQYISNGITDTLVTTMSGVTATIGGRTYYESISKFAAHHFADTSAYLSNAGHIYTQLTLSARDTVSAYYLNDTTALNGTWVGAVNGAGKVNGVAARFVGQIVEKNINLTVAGKVYTGVVHSKVYLQYNHGQGFESYINYDFFAVQGIGIIELFFKGAGVTGSQALLSYSIGDQAE